MKWGFIAALLIAASASIFNLISFRLENLWAPTSLLMDITLSGAIGVILVLTAGALALVWRGKNLTLWLFIAITLVLIAGFAPRALDVVEKEEAQAIREEEGRRTELVMNRDIELRRRDVEERISAQRPYSPAEAMAFVESVGDSDLSYRSLTDHSDTTLALLQRALEGKIVDPNGLVKGVRPVDVNSEPLFLLFYRATVRPTGRGPVRARDWKVLKLLVANGADLTVAGAERLVEDLRKTPKPIDNVRDYVELD
jgi:hypothetical protein